MVVTWAGVVAAELEEKWIDKERVLDAETKGLCIKLNTRMGVTERIKYNSQRHC